MLRGLTSRTARARSANTAGPEQRRRTACVAPESALYFRPDGLVMACCSGWHVLGSVTGPDRQSLREIWEGNAAEALRSALGAGDFELGCFECGRLSDLGRRDESLARQFDRYDQGGRRTYPAMMDFALSNRCNLQCVQCSGNFSSSIRREREQRTPIPHAYDDEFLNELEAFLPHLVRAQFKGGEPFLIRENQRIWDRMLIQPSRPEISVTTNGTIWNSHVERYTAELDFDLIISVDAIAPDVLREIRVGIDPERLWANVQRFNAITRSTGRSLTLSYCLMSVNWHELGGFLSTTDQLDVLPHVIWVDGPANFNLLTMPRDELAAAMRALESEDRSLQGLSPRARAIWQDALTRINARLEQLVPNERPVTLSGSERKKEPAKDRLQRAAAELSAEHAGGLLTVEYANDVICSIDAPAWSRWLEPSTWVGKGLEETMMVIASSSGATMRSRVESIEGGAHRVELTFEGASPVRRLRGIHLPDETAAGSSFLLLAEAGANS